MLRKIDALDKRLIALLARDGRLSAADLAKRAGISRPTAATRLKTLLDAGILHITGLVDGTKAGELTTAFVGLKLDQYRLEETVEKIGRLDEVSWAAVVTGRYDIIAEVITDRGMSGLYDFLNRSLMEVGGVASSEMFVVMKSAGKWSAFPTGMLKSWAAETPGDSDLT